MDSGYKKVPTPAVWRPATHRECKLLETYMNTRYGHQTEQLVGQYAKEQLYKSLRRA